MKTLFISMISLLAVTAAMAQNITGTVTDAFTKKAMPGVVVTTDSGSNPMMTDSLGQFQVSCQSAPFYINLHFIGYEDLNVKVAGCDKPVKVSMVPSAVQLNTVQINSWATDKNNDQLNLPKSVGVLSTADMKRGNNLSLQNSLNLIPGVDMQARTPFGGQRIVIRGYYGGGSNGRSTPSFNFNGNGYQVYLNDIPVTDATGVTILDDVDFSTLGKVEVIKGPQSSLYGAGIGGVVNLYTERPAPNTTTISQEALGGSYGLWRTNTKATSAGNNYDVVVNYGHQNYNGFRDHDKSKKDYASFVGNYYASDKHSISAYFSYNKSYEELGGEYDSSNLYSQSDTGISSPAYIGNDSHVAIESYRLGLTDKWQFNKHFSEQTTLFGSGYTLEQPFAHGFNNTDAFNFGGRTGFVFETTKNKVGVHGILGAAFLKSNQYKNGAFIIPANGAVRPSTAQNYGVNANVFTEWNITLPLQFSIRAGGSLNFYKFATRNLLNSTGSIYNGSTYSIQKFSPVFTPSITVMKTFKDNASIYASASWGFTPPGLSNILDSRGQIDSTLKPESAIQYEIGTKGSFANKKLSYQVALFYLDIHNKLQTVTATDSGAAYTYTANIGKQRNMGVELALSYAIIDNKDKPVSLFRPFVSYTYSYFKYQDFKSNGNTNDTTTVDYSGNKVAGVAPNRINVGFDFELKYGLYLNATYQYVDKVPYTFDNLHSAKAYSLLNAKIGYHKEFFKHLGVDAYVGVDNMLGSTYYSFVFLGENLNQIAGDGYFLPAPFKPTIYGGGTLTYKF